MLRNFCDEPGRRTEIPPEQHDNEFNPAITGSKDTALREESNPRAPKVLEVCLRGPVANMIFVPPTCT